MTQSSSVVLNPKPDRDGPYLAPQTPGRREKRALLNDACSASDRRNHPADLADPLAMKIGSPLPHRKARIEIIPLIDIMFFLLASFMLASLSMMRLQSVKMNLPTAVMAKKDFKPDIINISVDKDGKLFVEKRPVDWPELHSFLSNKFRVSTNFPVYVSGDKDATHGTVIGVLDMVRRIGIQKVSFAIAPESGAAPK